MLHLAPAYNMKRLLLSLFILGAFSILPGKAFAVCQSIYGGGQTCTNTFSIHKTTTNGSTFSMSQTVTFQITVTNTGSQNISSINVIDTFPQFLSFVSGPGTFNSSNNTLTFVVNNLASGQSQSVNVSGKIANSGLPTGTPCFLNNVAGTDNNGNTNTASSQFCVQNIVNPTPTAVLLPVPQVKTTPPTGPEMLPLLALIPGALGGLYLRKKSKHNIEGGEK
jgi:uncharacterized repeat protein (TIGR01451 family)